MRKVVLLLLILISLLNVFPVSAQVQRHPELDAAFSMIEEGNPFLERYNQLTGADIQAGMNMGSPIFSAARRSMT